jgi:hypothetical protein
MGAAGG